MEDYEEDAYKQDAIDDKRVQMFEAFGFFECKFCGRRFHETELKGKLCVTCQGDEE